MGTEASPNPVISVIVPVYKAEAYLEECVNSIRSQSFTDFELLLVDDGSPDHCPALCEELAAKDSRIRVFHQKNQGQAAARNHALQHAMADWICFVDSDDAIHPQMLESLYWETQHNDAAIVGCDRYEASSIPADFNHPHDPIYKQLQIDEHSLLELYQADNPAYWCIWGKLIRKEIVTEIPMTEGRFYEDNAVMCQWLLEANRVCLTEDTMYFYRINPQGTTKSNFSLKKTDYLWALQEQLRFYRRVHYRNMEATIAGRYLSDAYNQYNRVLNELHNSQRAAQIRAEMRHTYRTYYHRLTLPEEKMERLRNLLSLRRRLTRKAKSLLHFH